jgi:hypothetical protein
MGDPSQAGALPRAAQSVVDTTAPVRTFRPGTSPLPLVGGVWHRARVRSHAAVGADNNARWCDIVCRSHGLPTRFDAFGWVALRRSPPFYPDAVTLRPDASAGAVLDLVDASSGCSVKDSFAELDLTGAGFRVLFDAQWLRRVTEPRDGSAAARWRDVRSAAHLRLWGSAHGGGDVFRASLLDHPDVRVLAAYDGESLAGGAILNRGGSVVGLSNVFSVGPDVDRVWAGAVAAVGARYPGLAIVGYESGTDLDAARAVGFATTGPLRVWLRD